jgi:hypothetical protein
MKPLFAILLITAVCSFAEEPTRILPAVFFGGRVHHSPFTTDPTAESPPPSASKPESIGAWQDSLVEIKAIYPKTPGTLEWDGEVTVAIHYHNATQDKVRIFARPYFKGRAVVRFGSHPSPEYAPGSSGDIEGWFIGCGPTAVDEVRVAMYDTITNQPIANVNLPVHFEWEPMPKNPTPRPTNQ